MRIAVVGAGLAGLAAADAIAVGGGDPVVLEARDRVGGRVHSRTLPNGAVVEMGAEFVLPGCTAVAEEVERFGLGFWDKGMRYGRREPRGVEIPAGAMEAAVAAIEAALAKGEEQGESAASLLARLAIDGGAREAILARVEVSAAAPAGLVPAAELALLARVGDEPAPTIAGGNGRLAAALAAALPEGTVQLGTPVHAITADDGGVAITTDGDPVLADACVLAVPQPLIEDIAFEPGLPEDVRAALASISFGHAAKLFVPLSETAPPSATLAVPDRYWAWTATGDGDRPQPVLCAFAGSAPALAALGVDDGPKRWLEKVAALRPELALEPEGVVLSHWDADRWAGGAYSVAVPADALALLARPLGPRGRVVLAGEYLGDEMAGLMEGALRSGRRAAATALESPPEATPRSGELRSEHL